MSWLWWLLVPLGVLSTALIVFYARTGKLRLLFSIRRPNTNVLTQLAMLEERTKCLQGIEERIEHIRDKQDADSRELREKLYQEYSERLHDAVNLLKDTYGKMSETTANAFREITNRNSEVYRETAEHLGNIAEKLESAFQMVEQREHSQMREETRALKRKIDDLERDPLRVQLEELAEARTAQMVHEQSVKKITTLFWSNNGEIKFNEKIGQYEPDVFVDNHRVKIVADEVTTEELRSVRDKIRKVADYMKGLNANVGYVIIPNAGIDPETLRELKRTVPERGLYVVRLTEYAIHLQVWHDIASTGMIDNNILIEKGWSFLQIMEPIFDEFLATIQSLEQKDERDFTYRKNRYKEIKHFPVKLLDTLEKGTGR
ncbi:MAG: hypothetical protein ABSF24_09225 [Candidatus Bathyarchaeia archaeon]